MKNLMTSLLLLLPILCVAACGQPEEVTETKSFRFAMKKKDEVFTAFVVSMMDEYNRRLGYKALTRVDDASQANSYLRFYDASSPESLTLNGEERIGHAMPSRKLKESIRYVTAQKISKEQKDVYEHGMTVSFQREYIREAQILDAAKDSQEYLRVFKLFCHEVGHGMMMEHVEERSDVMYPAILDEFSAETFDHYFDDVRAFIFPKH